MTAAIRKTRRLTHHDTAPTQMFQLTLRAQEVRGRMMMQDEQLLNICVSGRPAWVEAHLKNRLPIPHTFVIHTYTKPTKCHLCHKVYDESGKNQLSCDSRY